MTKQKILQILSETEKELKKNINKLSDTAVLIDYAYLARTEAGLVIWTDAIQKALNEHEILIIPDSDDVYYVDNSIIIPSGRRIEAGNAVIRLTENTYVLMMRNKHVVDGTHFPEGEPQDCDISINGGRWEESRSTRGGYSKSGKIDEAGSMQGVSACMLFSGVQGLSLTNMIFAHTAGFAVQVGNVKNALFENISFVSCYADGLHINGNTENITARHISGKVGDDLVALNMFDWPNSSINFGPMKNVLCEDLNLDESSLYKAIRIEPGTWYYDDGTGRNCSADNIIIRKVRGVKNFKFYLQTMPYRTKDGLPKVKTGSGDSIWFEDIILDIDSPIDSLPDYMNSDPVTGTIAGFEFGAELGTVTLSNIKCILHRDNYPQSYLAAAGPKSVIMNGIEVFDPYVVSGVKKLVLDNVEVNGRPAGIADIKEIVFSNGSGKFGSVEFIPAAGK